MPALIYRPTCRICGGRESTTTTKLDGRLVPACAQCVKPVAPPATLDLDSLPSIASRAIAVALACPGLRSCEIGDRMGLARSDRDRNAIAQGLGQAVRDGYLARQYDEQSAIPRYVKGAKEWDPSTARPPMHRGSRARRAAQMRLDDADIWNHYPEPDDHEHTRNSADPCDVCRRLDAAGDLEDHLLSCPSCTHYVLCPTGMSLRADALAIGCELSKEVIEL